MGFKFNPFTGKLDIVNEFSPANTFTIAESGGDYTTIQAALDDNVTTDTLFLVYPGTYTDDTIHFTANNQEIRGMGISPSSVKVTTASSNIVDYGDFTRCRINRMKMEVTAGTTLVHTVTGAAGSCNLVKCHTVMTTSYATAGIQPSCIHSEGAGTVKVSEGTVEYNHSGSNAAVAKALLNCEANDCSTTFELANINIVCSGASFVSGLSFGTGATEIYMDRCFYEIEDNGTAIVVGLYVGGAATGEFLYNSVHIKGTGVLAVGMYINAAGADVRSIYNHIHIEGATANNSFYINDVNSTIISQFDDIIAAEGTVNTNDTGTITKVNSEDDGDLTLTGTLDVTGEATIGDGSKLKTNAAPVADEEIANKKYVDDANAIQDTAIGLNTSKVTNATHTGEVTGSGALAVADNIIDEANLKLDEAPTNDHVLTADSAKSGGMKWAAGIRAFLALTDTPSAYTSQAGRVPSVNTGETALEFDDTVFIDSVNTRLGIGTAAPDSLLHVLTPNNSENMLFETTDTTFGRIGFDLKTGFTANAGDFFRFNFRGDKTDVVQTVWDESASAFKELSNWNYISDCIDYGDTQFVDINVGDSASNFPLNILGKDNAFLRFDNNHTALGDVRCGLAGSDFTIWAGGAVKMTVKSDGKVGIGTTSPDTKLHVDGAITTNELSADPSDPAEGSNVQWQSDGTGSGDDGDILMKITAGGVTKTTTLVDFSAL